MCSEISITAPASAIWAGLAELGYLKRSHRFCAEKQVEHWPGVGPRDAITCCSARRYQRRFVNWREDVDEDRFGWNPLYSRPGA